MADKLTYKGGSNVVGSSGTMKLVLPKGGGDFHRVARWWGTKGTVAYVEAAIFKVPLDNGETVRLVLPGVKAHMTVEIRHDGAGAFTFPKEGGLERVAVVGADSLDLIHEYQFSKISGGSVLKRTIGSLPTGFVDVAFSGIPTITGTPNVGETLTLTASSFTGGFGSVSSNLILQVSDNGTSGWAFRDGNPDIVSGGTATFTLQASDETKYFRASYQVTDDKGTVSSNSAVLGPVVTTFVQQFAAADYSYTVGVNNIGTAETPQNVFTLNGADAPGLTFAVGDVVAFDYTSVQANHPLALFTDSTKSTPYTNGVENQGAQLLWTVAETGTISYQCVNHANMGGTITVS